jgi:LIM homeobox protein 2/9
MLFPVACVLQVWFQNARAKYRRNLLKQEGGGGDKNNSPKAGEEAGKLPDMPRSPSGLSDMSSSTSMSDLHTTSSLDSAPAHPSLSDLFAQSIHTMS